MYPILKKEKGFALHQPMTESRLSVQKNLQIT